MILVQVIDQHTEDASMLSLLRNDAVTEPHYDLADLAEQDNRLAAQLDGLLVAGESAWPAVETNLKIGEPGEIFTAAWLAIALQDGIKLDQVIKQASQNPENYRALVSACAWNPWKTAEKWAEGFLRARNPAYHLLAINICALHRKKQLAAKELDIIALVNEYLQANQENPNLLLVARCLRALGELGYKQNLPQLKEFVRSDVPLYQFWAAWACTMLGDNAGLNVLLHAVSNKTEFAGRALKLLPAKLSMEDTRSLLKNLAQNELGKRLAIQGAGYSGDPYWIPGLLKMMEEPELARVAGEAMSMITGLDLAYLDLDTDWPEGFEAGPTEDPDDEDVAMDEDESLPWPNPQLLAQWWQENMAQYQSGVRYLCGKPITEAQCIHVLKQGYQRQRNAAALELALMGKPYFETRAPGSVQKALLDAM